MSITPDSDLFDHKPAWPAWVAEFRDHQVDALEQILDAYDRGKRIVVLDAPVGAGKTLIAEMARRALSTDMLFAPHSKSLQAQFLEDFPYAAKLMGRDNYPVANDDVWPWPGYSCGDCVAGRGGLCMLCEGAEACPYKQVKEGARVAPVTVVNMAYMLLEAAGKGSVCGGREFAVVDECDVLEGVVLGMVEFRVSEWEAREWGLTIPKKGSHMTTIGKWVEGEWMAAAEKEYARLGRGGVGSAGVDDAQIDRNKKKKRLAAKMAKAKRVVDGTVGGGAGDERQRWVRDKDRRGALVMKPVTVDWACEKMVWRHAEKWLVMSGTVVDANVMMDGLGVARDEWELVTVPMTFPKQNRPVRLVPAGDMSRKGGDEDVERVKRALEVVLAKHPDENMVVHTVSYRLADEMVDVVRAWEENKPRDGRVWTYRAAQDRDDAIEQFKKEGGVLVGPSVDRGVDLPGELCRVQVIVKMPYPYLGDKRVAERMRMEGGARWYATETARTIVQMCGRGVRSADDQCVVYVLDKSFMGWYKQWKGLMPRWWVEALRVEKVGEYI